MTNIIYDVVGRLLLRFQQDRGVGGVGRVMNGGKEECGDREEVVFWLFPVIERGVDFIYH